MHAPAITPVSDQRRSGAKSFLETILAHVQDALTLRELSAEQLLEMLKSVDNRADIERALLTTSEILRQIAAILEETKYSPLQREIEGEALRNRQRLVEKRAILSSPEITATLGITRQALSKAVNSNRLFALEVGGENFYPAFIADPGLDRRKLERISKILGDLPGWEKWSFFTSPTTSLAKRTPLDALKAGMYKQVAKAALGFAER